MKLLHNLLQSNSVQSSVSIHMLCNIPSEMCVCVYILFTCITQITSRILT